MFPRTTRLLSGALVTLWTSTTAVAQTPTDPSDTLFVPDTFVPLSAFVDDDGTAGQVVLAVKPRVLQWIQAQAGSLLVARSDPSGISYLAPTSVQPTAGLVTLGSTVAGTFTVVSDALVNDFFADGPSKSAVVTHWNASLNPLPDPANPRGGQQIGANDALGLLDHQGAVNTFCNEQSPTLTNLFPGVLDNSDPSHADPVFGQYAYPTDKIAVFSDGTEVTPAKDGEPADADVPAYERYIGENYATSGVTRLGCVWLSDRIRTLTGYPIMHRNHPFAFDPAAPASQQVVDGAPIFQVVHAYLVDYQDPAVVGSESSLATFLLPPGWTTSASSRYPVLFNGFYDIHSSTFGVMGVRFLSAIGNVLNDTNERTVGILWNGGGAGACQTMHASAYKNADRLFLDADALVHADRDRVVISGGSRGGTTSLAMAANPGSTVYRAWFAVANNPQVRPDETMTLYHNSTYQLIQSAGDGLTGYKGSFLPGWVGPGGLSAGLVALSTLFGTTDTTVIAQTLSSDSQPYRAALLAKGTAVVLRSATHDFSHSFSHLSRYADNLAVDGVPRRFEISYRFGHTHAVGVGPSEEDLLQKVLAGNPSLSQPGDFFYRRVSEVDYQCGVEFTPSHAPLVIEAPVYVGAGQSGTFEVSGPPGTTYSVIAALVLEPGWIGLAPPTMTAAPFVFQSGTLPAGSSLYTSVTHTVSASPAQASMDTFWYGAVYTPPGGTATIASSGTSAPPLLPEPSLTLGPIVGLGVAFESRTGGLASDPLFP